MAEMLDWRLAPIGVFLGENINGHGWVLDVGCGSGDLGRMLADGRPDIRYAGVDVCEQRIPAGDFYTMALPELPGLKGEFDAVVCMGTLWFVRDTKEAVLRLVELSKEYLIIEVIVRGERNQHPYHRDDKGYITEQATAKGAFKVYVMSHEEVDDMMIKYIFPKFRLAHYRTIPLKAVMCGLLNSLGVISLILTFEKKEEK